MELKEKLKALPNKSGVYLMKDKFNKIIYVGKAKNLKKRVNQYFDSRPNKEFKTIMLVQNIIDFDFIITESEIDALILENNLIKKHQPHYNILLKDAKTFPYIKINTNSDFPKIEITRKILKDNAKYFGPYLKGVRARDILDIISFAFQLRSCNKTFKKVEKRECLNFFLGKCSAPCTNKINKKDYSILTEKVINFLKGNTKDVETILTQKMQQASLSEQFERAIELRELLNKLNNIKNIITTQFLTDVNADIFGFFSFKNSSCVSMLYIRNGKLLGCNNQILLNNFDNILNEFILRIYSENAIIPSKIFVPFELEDAEKIEEYLTQKSEHKVEIIVAQKGKFKTLSENANINAKEYLEKNIQIEMLKEQRTTGALSSLQEKLNLKKIPMRIECYDISNISGTNQVASMVVFENGEAKKSDYRKFKIKWVQGANDFECLKEVIFRRMNELKSNDSSFSCVPDLMVIDGGKGQLSSVSNILREFNTEIDLISLAKKEEEVFVENNLVPYKLSKNDYALQLLIRIRDEAHRFAITFHRQRRNKSAFK